MSVRAMSLQRDFKDSFEHKSKLPTAKPITKLWHTNLKLPGCKFHSTRC